jgi:hypothetical protein
MSIELRSLWEKFYIVSLELNISGICFALKRPLSVGGFSGPTVLISLSLRLCQTETKPISITVRSSLTSQHYNT